MIRINLLPPDERPRSRGIELPKAKVLLPVGLFALLVAPIAVSGIQQTRTHSDLTTAVAEARAESIRLKPQIERVHQLNRQTQELNHRIDVVADLDQASTYLVEVLDDISEIRPKHMWLGRLEEDQKRPRTLIMEGFAFTNLAVADLMVRLEKLGKFDDVVLVIIEEDAIEGRKVLRFEVEVRMTYSPRKESTREHP